MPSARRRSLLLTLLALGASGLTLQRLGRERARAENPLRRLLGDPSAAGEFSRVSSIPDLTFPRDHGTHRDFRHEWWYFTGHLADAAQRRFGFQLTFFRFAFAPGPSRLDSAWATHEAMLAHFALSDLEGGRFFADQRLERPVLDLAGATDNPLAVWVGDWGMRLEHTPHARWHLEARERGRQLALSLTAMKPIVLHGDHGYSRKGDSLANASCYYSQSRLLAEGEIRLNDQRYAVEGNAWFDHEWGSGVLDANTDGWDWFGLQLDDGSELMLYRLRDHNGRDSPWGSGTVIHPDGKTTALKSSDFQLSPTRHWTSPVSDRRYPTAWSVEVPGAALKLVVEALLPDQEWTGIVGYWEGAVVVTGTRRGEMLNGEGYMELTAYA